MKNRIIIILIVTVSTAIGIWPISVLGLFPFDQVKDSPVTKDLPNPSTPVINKNIRKLLGKHPNLYADFYAGFTALNPASTNKLEDFVPVMKQFPDQFMLSTDSGFDIGEEAAIGAMYQLLDKLDDPNLARKIAHDNLDTIIRNQPATETQIAEIRKKSKETGQSYEWSHLSKVEAGQILWSK